MLGKMQYHPLLISSLLEHATRAYPDAQIASRTLEGPIHHCGYADIARRARQLANALTALGVQPGDRIGTLAWNGYRHLELYYGVSGMGAILHTLNPRLFAEQLDYIIRHAKDSYVFFDACFAPLLEKLAPHLPQVKGFVAMTDAAHLPACAIPRLLCYEDLLAAQPDNFCWPTFDENSASSLCYTSGTTGHPKGVLYSHRATVLHALTLCTADGFALSANESVLAVVPMFHVNAWGLPYAAPLSGAKLVLPGPALDGASIYALLRDEAVTVALGVPTVWLMLQHYVEANGLDPQRDLALRRIVIGGAAAPRSMVETFETRFGCRVLHAWGMTELSPLGTICNPLPKHHDATLAERLDLQAKQGRSPYGVELEIADDDGQPLAHDGRAFGHLLVKGHWVTAGYYGEAAGNLNADGYFDTGDIATLDADGYMQITDRAKDVIKSGGEWISSIELENLAVGHPDVAEAAVIGIPHDKWQERPLLILVCKPGRSLVKQTMLDYLADKVAKWWLPDDVVVVEQLPHTATGKLMKVKLRELFRDYQFPDPSGE